ncbi:membrane protein [Candidatus Magnetobacterium bavaricum]|uniref:Membrane protein n=1 Tax=Candidatus Magnetobacterium bavaricum TaxID=29290 RepID=A0A0F3GQT6_9BACT|nr:membrane protein [Candidatus Magnetobacterium bavaricum]
MLLSSRSFMAFFLPAVVSLFLVFSSYILLPSVFHDNANFIGDSLEPPFKAECSNYNAFKLSLKIGRPFSSFIECYLFKYITSVSDIQKVKAAVVLVYAFGAALLALLLWWHGVSAIVAFFVSVSVFMLPGPQFHVFLSWPPSAMAPSMALLSYMLLSQTWLTRPSDGKTLAIWTGKTALAFVLLLMTMFTYQAHAFFFFVAGFVAVSAATGGNDPRRQIRLTAGIILRDVFFFGVSSVVYYANNKLFIPAKYRTQILEEIKLDPDYRVEISIKNLLQKLSPLIHDLFPIVFNFWSIYLPKVVGYVVFLTVVIVLTGLLVVSVKKKRFNSAIVIVYAAVLLFAILAPWILTPTKLVLRRFLFAEMAFALILIHWMFTSVLRSVTDNPGRQKTAAIVFAVTLAVYGAATSSFNVYLNAKNSNAEFMFIKDAIAPFVNKPITRIHVVKPVNNDTGFNGRGSIGDEFNCNATAFTQDIQYVLSAALIDLRHPVTAVKYCLSQDPAICADDTPKGGIIATVSEPAAETCASKDTVFIDMNVLLNTTATTKVPIIPMDYHRPCQSELMTVVSEDTTKKTVKYAFDYSAKKDDFWEALIDRPIPADITFHKPRVIRSYSLSSGEDSGKMPISWEFMARDEGGSWVLLDKQVDAQRWPPFEKRVFPVANTKEYKQYRFMFIKGQHLQVLRLYEIEFD